ncbi:SulP family inorganic anion transporter [uncultured Azohydromonas sp.]|jgi:high affinity sulphate transporter 1|uniref:SulP family inorganic anion transporter n=1 Tax=uncultured Azohydromonas sp. TaxID=487342 RepID=UPI002611C8A3|nr:SulP family inorganic anion transporter [uncultured Azohydromonas sp.]
MPANATTLRTQDARLTRLLPMLRWWPLVNRRSLRADAMAGLSGAIILIPQAVAYASIAGLPPQYGIYTAVVPVIVAALFGSSLHLVSGPTAALSLVVFTTVGALSEAGSSRYIELALTLTFMVGALTLVLGLARLGSLLNFVSHSVVVGFTAGAAVLIAASQLKHFLGLAYPSTGSLAATLQATLDQLSQASPYVTAVGLATLAAGILCKRFAPRQPYMIVAMAAGAATAAVLEELTGHQAAIPTVAALPAVLPPLSRPDLSVATLQQLAPVALAITMLSLTEALSIARAVALKSGQRINGNQELFGQGLANLLGSFFSSYVSSGSFTRSGLNYSAGARTPLAAVFSSVCLVGVLLVLAPAIRLLPLASMAAVLFMVAWSLVDLHHIRMIVRTSRGETAVLLATFASTLLLQLEFAIYVGIILSLVLFIERTARPHIRDALPAPGTATYHFVERRQEKGCPQLRIVFIDGPLYFGAVDHVQRRLQQPNQMPAPKHLLILAPGISFIDLSGAELLAQEARRRRAIGGALYFHRLQGTVQDTLVRTGFMADIGAENLFVVGQDVMETLYDRLDARVCQHCTARVFRQCQGRLPGGSPCP